MKGRENYGIKLGENPAGGANESGYHRFSNEAIILREFLNGFSRPVD